MRVKQVGIVGFGEMGKRHGLEYREATQGLINIAGVVEPDDRMYREGCEWNGCSIPRFGSVAEMLAGCDLDGVIIASPNHLHLENLREFSGRDIALLIEKPLDSTLENVAEVVRFASQYSGKIVVDHVMRHAPIIRRARQMIDDGRLGKVASFQFTQRIDCGPFHTFRRTKAAGGGQIIEKATHDLDVMLYLCNALPKRVAMISKQQHVGGKKSNALTCSECDESLVCPSVCTDSMNAAGLKDIAQNNDLCVFAEEVDIADNETCLIELSNGTFGTYSHTYFCRMQGHSRIYEVIGTKGAMTITLSVEDPTYRGEINYYPRSKDIETETIKFEYFNKIHYNGGPYVGRHFLELMSDPHAQPFTTVNQAFVAEILGFAAMRASEEGDFVEVESMVPTDLTEVFRSTY